MNTPERLQVLTSINQIIFHCIGVIYISKQVALIAGKHWVATDFYRFLQKLEVANKFKWAIDLYQD